jgi:APA family basic amino acid/polyamine antiporter
MIGAGVFAAFAPAAGAAGSWLLLGLLIAAVVAYCNAVSSAQLAAAYPTSGGTYVYGRERLGDSWGFAAGWSFVIGKTASCAAMALTFASYAIPGPWWAQRLVAVAGVLGLTALNYRGIQKTALLTRILVSCTLVALLVAVLAIWTRGFPAVRWDGAPGGIYGVLQAAGLLFFAFAGYARIATLGEEVRDPGRTIPRAIPLALFITVGVYFVVGATVLFALGPVSLAASAAPLATAVPPGWVGAVVRIGAVLASLGALLALIAGVGRTSLAMARNGDLPRWLSAVHDRFRVPHRAELVVGVVVCLLVLAVDLRGAIGFSSFGVLVYYAIANVSAYTQPPSARRWPRAVNVAGLAGCVVLVATLPPLSIALGAAVLAVGLAARAIFHHSP